MSSLDGPGPRLWRSQGKTRPTHAFDARRLRAAGTFVIDVNPDPDNKAAREADLQLPLGAEAALRALAERAL